MRKLCGVEFGELCRGNSQDCAKSDNGARKEVRRVVADSIYEGRHDPARLLNTHKFIYSDCSSS